MTQLYVKVMLSVSPAQQMVNLLCILINCLRMKYPFNDGNSSAGVWIRKDLKEGDFSYRCMANNTVGTAEKTVNVTVKGTV